ncbi:MAG: hypothetical protein ACD_65C00178G0002 [uncultured bacterium]|nr:MAG: hypothetical protein ACD_65C00178G0002 [uncultured bacterium]
MTHVIIPLSVLDELGGLTTGRQKFFGARAFRGGGLFTLETIGVRSLKLFSLIHCGRNLKRHRKKGKTEHEERDEN